MRGVQLRAGSAGKLLKDLVPAQPFIGSDVEDLTGSPGIAQQPDEAFGEIGVVGESPERGAVAMNDHRLPAQHAVDDGPGAGAGQQGFIVGMGGAHDGEGEFLPAPGAQQTLLAGDLVARVFPVGVIQDGGFGHRQAGGRGLVSGGGADEEVLGGTPAEEIEIALELIGGEDDEIGDRVEFHAAERFFHGSGIGDIRIDQASAFRRGADGFAAVKEIELDAALNGEGGTSRADHAGAADEEDFHGKTPG